MKVEDKKLKQKTLKDKTRDFLATDPTDIEIEKFFLVEVLPYDKRSMTEILDEEVRQMYKVYEGYQIVNGLLELDEDHPQNYIVTQTELLAMLTEDTEDEIRQWVLSRPDIGDILQGHPSDLPIQRIA